jgi:hypothetical protein
MKKFFLFFVVVCFSNSSFCQKTEAWKVYLKDSVYNSDTPKHIYIINTLAGKQTKTIHYSTKKGINVLSINYGDSVIVYKALYSPNLFEIIDRNLEAIKKAKKFLNTEKKGSEIRESFEDPIKVCSQLGMRFNEFSISHIPRFNLYEIENTKNKKRKQGMLIINQLYAILEEAEKSK